MSTNKNIYNRVAPHIARSKADGSTAYLETRDHQNLFLLMRRQEALKDATRHFYNPHLTGNRIRTSGIYNYAVKGYSANSVMRELGDEIIVNGDGKNTTGWQVQSGATITSENDTFKIETNAVSLSAYQTTTSIIAGRTYRLRADIISSTSNWALLVGLAVAAGNSYNSGSKIGALKIDTTFVASASGTTYLTLYVYTAGVVYADNFSITEVLATDLNQSTAANQPQLDRVALTEPLGLKNQNGGVGFMTHSPISFAANEAWTVECVVNANGNTGNNSIWVNFETTGLYNLNLRYGTSNFFGVRNASSGYFGGSKSLSHIFGKAKVLHFVALGNGTIKVYIDGVLFETLSGASNMLFSGVMAPAGNAPYTSYHYSIYSKALSDTEILEGASILRSIFPEIPSVQIGTQRWAVRNWDAVTTPMGNTIQERQVAANVEKITNGGFDSDTSWNKELGWSISGGVAVANVVGSFAIWQTCFISSTKYYKLTVKVVSYTSGNIAARVGNNYSSQITPTAGTTYEFWIIGGSAGTTGIQGYSFVGSIDNVSVVEYNWNGSTELYTAIYNQTSGTVEQKTYAALKAAAMWRNVSSSVEVGSVFGKLYNWYAVKLLQMDIDYYNAANPNSQFGWKTPNKTDLTTLRDGLGGESVAGGKLKMPDLAYWNTPNTGADNSSGFSGIASGYITSLGENTRRLETMVIWGVDGSDSPWISAAHNSAALTYIASDNKIQGMSIRLIQQT